MIIFYHIKDPNGLGADRWIYDGWRHAFEDLGHQVCLFIDGRDLEEKLRIAKPDLLMTSYSLWDFKNPVLIENWKLKTGNCRVAMFVDNDFLKNEIIVSLAREGKLADVFFGERSEEMMANFEKSTGQKYHLIANAADKKYHFATAPVEKYKCDIIYIGAYLPKKREAFQKILLPLMAKYNVKIYGPYWTWKDLLLLAGNKLASKLELTKLGNWFGKKRMLVLPEDENKVYSSAKICVNFHERKNDQDYDLVNQRAFKIPACGGFEICDWVKSLRHFFAEDEVIMAESKDDWFRKIDYYLTHEKERTAIQRKGTERALRDHTYHNRVEQLLKIFNL